MLVKRFQIKYFGKITASMVAFFLVPSLCIDKRCSVKQNFWLSSRNKTMNVVQRKGEWCPFQNVCALEAYHKGKNLQEAQTGLNK